MTIKEIQNEIVDEFSMFDDWMQRYEYIIELGKTLPLIDEQYKIDENIIKGCQSKVWVHGEEQDGKIVFTADSDAILTKGIIAILIRAFSNQSPKDIESDSINYNFTNNDAGDDSKEKSTKKYTYKKSLVRLYECRLCVF